MKKFYLSFFIMLVTTVAFPQWQATNLSQFNYLTVTGTESYKGNLFSTLFNGAGADLYKLDPGNASWTLQTISGVNEIPSALVSAGSNLYMTSTSLGYGMLYRSNDASSFVLDTVGLPKISNGIALPYGLQYFNGKVLINLGSSGYWLKDTAATMWQHIDPVTSLNAGTDPLCYFNDTLFAHDNSGANIFYISGDYGATWTVRNTNLPSFFVGSVLVANKVTGRLYMAGAESNGNSYGVYYSDDNGFSWTMANLSSFIGTDASGGQQEVVTIYADGGEVYIALENDMANTRPDVLSSTTGIANMGYDTLGLVVDPAGTINGNRFVEHNGDIAIALNVRDVYLKGGSVAINELSQNNSVLLSPNPTTNEVKISSENRILTIEIFDISGRIIKQSYINNYQTKIDVRDLNKGLYYIRVHQNGNYETIKIIKQ